MKLLLHLLSIIIFVSVRLPFCDAHVRYSICSQTYDCGAIKGITYPFWGNSRRNYCGHPDFQLNCQKNSTQIQIKSETYRVLDINQTNQTMRIVGIDLINSTCPWKFVNTTLDFSLFNYTISDVPLTLFQHCRSMIPYNYSCGGNNEGGEVYGLIGSDPIQNLSTCNVTSVVLVLGKAMEDNLMSLGTILKSGFDVEYMVDSSVCKECLDTNGKCGYDLDLHQPTCFCLDETRCPAATCLASIPRGTTHADKTREDRRKRVVIAALIAGVVIITTIVVLFFCLRREYSSDRLAIWKKKSNNAPSVELFLKNHESLVPKRFKYSDIKKMTNSFIDKLGQGAYGSVFRGVLVDGHVVAVKVLKELKGNGEEFINEVASITRTSHVNIVTLLGFSVEDSKRALIYEFMPNGSLEKFIYDEKPLQKLPHLEWITLYKIAIGIARGLEYLHRGCTTRILHFDIKPHNILLDEDFCLKISDFGLAKLCLKKESIISMMGARGTPGYIAPELVNRNFGGVSHKSDVYSYGMMVLEMVGGRKNVDEGVENSSEMYFPLWIHKRINMCGDLGLRGVTTTEDVEIARKMILVGLWCIQMDSSYRPAMNKVLEMLEGSLETLQIPPMPFFDSPPRPQIGSSITSTS